MKRWLKICVAAFALTLGLATASTVDVHASSFTYFGNNGTKTYHHKVISYQKYTLNKTYNLKDPWTGASSQVRLYHLYVFHVARSQSRYQTWVKLTGHAHCTNSTSNPVSNLNFENSTMDGLTTVGIMRIFDSTPAGYTFSANASKAPYMLSKTGLPNGKSESFQLLDHSKTATHKLGKTTIWLYITQGFAQYQTLKLNLK
ncbi:hypothetical protein [Secundilactobacillus silagei]|uniref:Extracellular protein n=1 Tax=Secundilactobacillus silagei JCM 19001 TaxID=1302250 RepID=A0A1Z5IJW6_9LACO|nr:hypothetical protein [Secundilactobacillus silagei]TDG69932.1 hypothetical protein C5L25_002052 [Secundilactobacillus silagei JCM 19001]GAX02074.1 hypothetical protein IWT126_02138 [Secundilactobacillus silagei JCM 19001]